VYKWRKIPRYFTCLRYTVPSLYIPRYTVYTGIPRNTTSTHKLTRTWQGPCVVVKKNSPYSYVIEFDGKQQWCHANNLRKYNDRVIEVSNHNCAIIFDCDRDFGNIPFVKCSDQNMYDKIETQTYRESSLTVVDDEIGDVDGVETSLPNLCDDTTLDVRNPPVSYPESSVLENISSELCDDQYIGTSSYRV
jgi:hypothetical protein